MVVVFSFSNINNNDSVSYHNFNFTTLLKLNWRNKAKKLLTKSKNKMNILINYCDINNLIDGYIFDNVNSCSEK